MSLFIISLGIEESAETERLLRLGGYHEIAHGHTLEQAMSLLGLTPSGSPTFGIDAILLHVKSDVDSIAAIRKIRENYHYQDVPIIVVSSAATPESLQVAFAFGATDFVESPIRPTEIIARVRAALRLKHESDRRKARERELMEATRQLSDVNSLLTRMALVDGLTTLANRTCFDKSYDQEWRRAQRRGAPISLAMVDFDYFKLFNDGYGHTAGDDALRSVARLLRESLRRAGDFIARYGGEEFVAVLPETPSDGAVRVCENLRHAVEQARLTHVHRDAPKIITISIGVATCHPQETRDPTELIKAADAALYEAKRQGRNRVTAAPPLMAEVVQRNKSANG